MAASNPIGEMQFWDLGFPFQGIKLSPNDGGEMQFWDTGFPYQFLFPASTTTIQQVLTVLGVGT